jgi:hypothetical protein
MGGAMTLHPWTDYVICFGFGLFWGAALLLCGIRLALHTPSEMTLMERIRRLLAYEAE